MKFKGKIRINTFILLLLFLLFSFHGTIAAEEYELLPVTTEHSGAGENIQTIAAEINDFLPITVNYAGTETEIQTITVDYADDWLLRPDDEYNHKLMQASFGMAAAGFRDKTKDLSERDVNILDFFAQAGFTEPRTIDFDVIPTIDTIGTAIAYKKACGATLIAVCISGNNYQGEWAGNLTIDDDNRVKGFNDAADKVTERLNRYISDHQLSGSLRLWTAGYSRSAAVTNDFAADALESGLFQAVYAYTFATPRTTREYDAGKYHNIFNILNPFDIVPMIPFHEWGFVRYGVDLYFPASQTDSQWIGKAATAEDLFHSISEEEIIFNPQMDIALHTIFDYIAWFINSAEKYTNTYQNPLVEFIQTRDFHALFNSIKKQISFSAIRNRIIQLDKNARYQIYEFYNFLDYLSQLIYLSFLAQENRGADFFIWDPSLSVQENIAFNHYDKTYRAWLFSTDDPEELFSMEPVYAHVVIRGDIDVDVFDENGDYVCHIGNQDGTFSVEPEDIRMPDFRGDMSETIVYGERRDLQTLIVLPMDQNFNVGIYSHKDQTIRVSYAEYSADRLTAEVHYVYLDDYAEGEYFLETFDPELDPKLTNDIILQDYGLMTVEPWSGDLTYSPTAVMRLENDGIIHPTPKFLIAVLFFVLFMILALVIQIIIGIIKLIRRLVRRRKTSEVKS